MFILVFLVIIGVVFYLSQSAGNQESNENSGSSNNKLPAEESPQFPIPTTSNQIFKFASECKLSNSETSLIREFYDIKNQTTFETLISQVQMQILSADLMSNKRLEQWPNGTNFDPRIKSISHKIIESREANILSLQGADKNNEIEMSAAVSKHNASINTARVATNNKLQGDVCFDDFLEYCTAHSIETSSNLGITFRVDRQSSAVRTLSFRLHPVDPRLDGVSVRSNNEKSDNWFEDGFPLRELNSEWYDLGLPFGTSSEKKGSAIDTVLAFDELLCEVERNNIKITVMAFGVSTILMWVAVTFAESNRRPKSDVLLEPFTHLTNNR